MRDSSDQSAEETDTNTRTSISKNVKPSKSSSGSSSGIGTLPQERSKNTPKYDRKPSRHIRSSKQSSTTLKSLKDSMSKTKKSIKKGLFSKKSEGNHKTDEYDWAQEALILEKFEQDLLEEDTEEDIESFSDDENSDHYTDNERDIVIAGETNDSIHKIMEDKTMKKHSRSISNTRSRSTSRVANKTNNINVTRNLNKGQINKTYEEDTDYTSSELISESEGEIDGKIKQQGYSKKIQEHSDYSDKNDKVTDKPAMKTLKKTFTSMLSKLPFATNHAETSSESENGSIKSETSGHWEAASTLDRSAYQKRLMKKGSGNLGRAHSASSVNVEHKGIKTFEYKVISY